MEVSRKRKNNVVLTFLLHFSLNYPELEIKVDHSWPPKKIEVEIPFRIVDFNANLRRQRKALDFECKKKRMRGRAVDHPTTVSETKSLEKRNNKSYVGNQRLDIISVKTHKCQKIRENVVNSFTIYFS